MSARRRSAASVRAEPISPPSPSASSASSPQRGSRTGRSSSRPPAAPCRTRGSRPPCSSSTYRSPASGRGSSSRPSRAARRRSSPRRRGAARPRRRSGSLGALQEHLFEDSTPPRAGLDETVTLRSWPGEAREAVEIARAVQAAAARGVPFDRMAVLLRSPTDYREHLEEAFRRAAIPAFFARGTRRPDPAGRALLALLACAAEKLSARRFAEYLSLAQVPDAGQGADPAARWLPPEHDLLPAGPAAEPADDHLPPDPDSAPVVAGSLRAPWRW